MDKKLVEFLVVFLEKQLIPTVLSIAGAIISILLLKNDNWMILKLGRTMFCLLLFCLIFLGINLLSLIAGVIRNLIRTHRKNDDLRFVATKAMEIQCEQVSAYIDSLIPHEREILIGFLENNNKIYVTTKGFNLMGSVLTNSQIMNSSIFTGDIGDVDKNKYWIDPSVLHDLSVGMTPIGGYMQYKLKDNAYKRLHYIYKQKGAIGNF